MSDLLNQPAIRHGPLKGVVGLRAKREAQDESLMVVVPKWPTGASNLYMSWQLSIVQLYIYPSPLSLAIYAWSPSHTRRAWSFIG